MNKGFLNILIAVVALAGVFIGSMTWIALKNFSASEPRVGAYILQPMQGGTGLGFVASTSLLVGNGTSTFSATNSPNVAAIYATSTTASSTFRGIEAQTLNLANSLTGAGLSSCSGASSKLLWSSLSGNFSCGTDAGGSINTDFIQISNNNVTTLTASTVIPFLVRDAIYGSTTLSIATSTSARALSIHGSMLLNGDLQRVANVTATGSVVAWGGFFASSTNAFSGLISSYGGLLNIGSSSFNSLLNVTGPLNASTTLLVNNLSTLTGGFLSVASSTVNANLTLTGSLLTQGIFASSTSAWSGLSTHYAGLIIQASSTATANLSVAGPLSASSTLLVSGLTTTGGLLSTASSTVNGTLVITGNTTFPISTQVLGIGTTTTGALGITLASTSAYSYEQNIATIAAGDTTVTWTYGNQARIVLSNAAPAITFTDGYPGQTIRLIICQDTAGSREPTFSANVDWASSSANMFTDKSLQCDVVTGFWSLGTTTPGVNNNSKWFMFLNSGNF